MRISFDVLKARNLADLPLDIDSLLGKKTLFQVELKEGEYKDIKMVFNVTNVIYDLQIISNYCGLHVLQKVIV